MTDAKTIASNLTPIADTLTKHVQSLAAGIARLGTYQDSHSVIVAASLLEQSLEKALLSKMQPLPSSLYKSIFNNYGSMLSTISAKIDMAYALAILPKQMHDDLRTMNAIRNKFAHAIDITTFADPTIAGLLDKISGMDAANPNVRMRFLNRMSEIDKHLDSFVIPEAPEAS